MKMLGFLSFDEETRALLYLAAPSFLSSLSFFALSMTDVVIAGHLGATALSAVAFAEMALDFTLIVFTQGFNRGLNALCSQAYGAQNRLLLGRYTQMGCLCLTLACVPLAILWWFVGDLMALAGVSEETSDLATTYARISILWVWPRLMFQALSVYFQVLHVVIPAAVISLVFVFVNIGINYVLVFGIGSWNGLGFIALPIATSICQYLRLLVFVCYMMVKMQYHAKYWEWNWKFLNVNYLKSLLKVGVPLMAGQAFENAQIQLCGVFVAMVGEIELASHNAMLNLFFFVTSPIYGISGASVTRIGMYLGANDASTAKRVADITLKSIVSLSVIIAITMMSFRNVLGCIFSNDARIIENIADIDILSSGGYVLLSMFYYSMAVLNAQARTVPIIAAFLIGAWVVGVPSAYFIGIYLQFGLLGVWVGMSIGYFVTSSLGLHAAMQSDWENEARLAALRSNKKHAANENSTLLNTNNDTLTTTREVV